MLITVKSSRESWKSPDGKITIYDIVDQDGSTWQTMSRKIGTGINQSFECTTRVSDRQKTYLILTPDPNSQYNYQTKVPSAAQTTLEGAGGTGTPEWLQDFITATQSFGEAVDKLVKVLPSWDVNDTIAPSGDVVPSGNTITTESAAELLGGEIVDDL